MKHLFLLLALSVTSIAALAEDFESFLNHRLEDKRLHLPTLQEGGIYKMAPVDLKNPDFAELYNFYKTNLQLKPSDQIFTEKLAPLFRMAQGRPVRPYYNDSLIWVMRKNKPVYILRPVDTVTGCDSSCAPIVFHLVMDPKGNVEKLLEEPAEPLRKIYHAPMTKEDKARILKILKKLPAAFQGIDHPDRLTNSFTAFPPQTWTFFSPYVVEGAAYTTYRIYESALQVQQRLRNKDNEIDLLTDLYGRLSRIENATTAANFLEDLMSPSLEKKMGPNAQNFAASAYYEVLVYMAQQKMLKPDDLKKWLKKRNDRKNELQHQCALIRDLLPWSDLSKAALDSAAQCPKDVKNLYGDLLNGKLWESQAYQTPQFLLKDENSFFYFLERFLKERPNSLPTQRMLAEAHVYFPDESKARKLPEDTTEQGKLFQKDAESSYRDALKRRDLNPWSDKPVTGFFSLAGNAPLEMSLPASKIIVFFAPWCPHCQKLLHTWGADKQLSPDIKEKLILIQSFAADDNWETAQKFCKDTGLESDICSKLWILAKEKNEGLIKSLGFYTVPRIVITDPKGKVLVYDYEINLKHPLQSTQDLIFLWEEANKPK